MSNLTYFSSVLLKSLVNNCFHGYVHISSCDSGDWGKLMFMLFSFSGIQLQVVLEAQAHIQTPSPRVNTQSLSTLSVNYCTLSVDASGKWLCCLKTNTQRLRSIFLPQPMNLPEHQTRKLPQYFCHKLHNNIAVVLP